MPRALRDRVRQRVRHGLAQSVEWMTAHILPVGTSAIPLPSVQ
jgi:hypothetical protein